jgi:hypothetical protein
MKKQTIIKSVLILSILILFFGLSQEVKAATGDFNSRAVGNWNAPATWSKQLTGTVAFVNGNTAVVGTGTLFTTELAIGDLLMRQSSTGTIRGTVASITDNTHLTLVAGSSGSASGAYSKEAVPTSADGIITITHNITVTADVTVDQVVSTGTRTLTINSGVTMIVADGTGTDFSTASTTLTVDGTLNVNGTFTGPDSITINNGGVINVTGTFNPANGNPDLIINTGGNLNLTGTGSITMSSISTLNVSGNVTMSDSSFISLTRGNGGALGTILSGGLITMSGTSNIKGAAGSNANGVVLNVLSGGNLIMGSSATISGPGKFTLASGGSMSIGSSAGITSSGATGNVQVTGTRTFDTAGNYTYNSIATQNTGNGLPATVNNLTINNVIDTVTLDSSVAVAGTLQVSTSAILVPVASAVISGAGTLTGNGTVQVTRTVATADFSSQYTIANKTITNLTVDYAGAAQQTVSALTYGGLKISNNSGSDPDTSPSVIFAGSVSATNFIATTASIKIRFPASSTFTSTNINLNGQAAGTRVALRSSSAGSPWNFVVSGSQTVLDVDAKDSNACSGNHINAINNSNLDSGGNSCWDFGPTKFVILDPTDDVVGNSVTITIQAQDASNNVVTAYSDGVTLNTDGSATGEGLVNITSGVGTIQISDEVAETVNLSLTDTQATGLNVSSTQDLVFATGSIFQFAINNPGDITAGTRVGYTVTRKDQFGNLIASGSSTVYLYTSSASGLGFFYDAVTGGNTITSITIPDASSSANFWYGEGRAGSFSITVSDNNSAPDGATGVADASDSVEVSAGATTVLSLNDPGGMVIGNRLGYTVTRKDAFDNVVTAGSGTFYLYSNSTGANKAFYDAGTGGNVITSIAIPDGSASANFWYFEDTEGTWTITASDNNLAPDGVSGVVDATDNVTVTAVPVTPTKIVILDPADSTAGTVTAVTIRVIDDSNSLDTSFSGTVTLNTSGSAIGGGIITIANGIGNANLNDNTAETVNLSLADSGGTGLNVSSTQDVIFAAGGVAQFTIDDPGDGIAGNRFSYTVTRKDQFGNLVTSGIDTVYLYTNSLGTLGKFYDSASGGNIIVSANIAVGQSSAVFWYEEGTAGSWTITVSDNNTVPDGASGVADTNDTIAITPATTHDFFLNDPGDMTTSTRLGYTVTRKDAFGNLVTSGSQVVNLGSSSSSANKAFFDVATGGSGLISVTIADGASSKNFWYFDDTAGSFVITASGSGITDATDNVTVSIIPIVATKLVISAVSNALTGSTVTVTVSAEDEDSNIDTTFIGDVTLKATGSATGEGVVNLINGVGTKNIAGTVSEIVTLSLQDTGNMGLNIDSTQTITFSAVLVPSSPTIVGEAVPTGPSFAIKFSGTASPGSLVNVLGVPEGGNAAQAVILDQQISGSSGSFGMSLDNPDTKSAFYIVSLTDKNNIPGQLKIFSKVPDVATLSNIVFAPTISLLRSSVRKADFLSVFGFASAGSSMEAQFDGKTKAKETTIAGSDGSYKILLSTANLSLGKHSVRVRSVTNGKPSDYSLSRSFAVSALFNPEVDLNGDGIVDVKDINILNSDWKSTDPSIRDNIDFNHDGKVDLQDLSIFTQAIKH